MGLGSPLLQCGGLQDWSLAAGHSIASVPVVSSTLLHVLGVCLCVYMCVHMSACMCVCTRALMPGSQNEMFLKYRNYALRVRTQPKNWPFEEFLCVKLPRWFTSVAGPPA